MAATPISAQLPRGFSEKHSVGLRIVEWGIALAARPLHALLASPCLLFLAALTAMLFRPPDVKLYFLDRIAFALLIFVVMLRALLLRQPLRATGPVIWPMLGLLLLALGSAISQPYEPETWSVLAAKWVVPLAMFYMARLVFTEEASLRWLETFALIALGYLSITAILFLSGAKSLILPSFIVDESLGIHAERARGPFLQAVANGVSLNLLGLVALDSYRRRRLRGVLALLFGIALLLAVLATKTRAVWLSFAASLAVLLCLSPSRRIRRACLCLALAGVVGLLCALTFEDVNQSLTERFQERSPVEFRMAVYRAGWDMFCAKPLFGWGAAQMQPDLGKRISGFHQEEFYFHNTFLEIGVQYGLLGLALYGWVVFDLFHLAHKSKAHTGHSEGTFLDGQFRSVWPVLLGVYLLNACFVVMNYQFVNGLLFTLAGILAAQNHTAAVGARSGPSC